MRYINALFVIGIVLLLATGCTRAVVGVDNPARVAADTYQTTYEAAIDVLRDEGFVIDRRDYRFGQITTHALGSPNAFEVWNDQNTTLDQAIESTLANEQRRVNVAFEKLGTGDGYAMQVEVVIERKQVPTRRLAGSARRNISSNLSAPPKELADRGITGSYFEPVGRDELLEARLMKMISDRVANAE